MKFGHFGLGLGRAGGGRRRQEMRAVDLGRTQQGGGIRQVAAGEQQ
jgi:hypothetical protein